MLCEEIEATSDGLTKIQGKKLFLTAKGNFKLMSEGEKIPISYIVHYPFL